MKLPVLKQDAPKQAQPGKGPGALAKKLLRKRVVIPAAACVLVGAFVLRLAGGGRPVSAADLTYTTAAVELSLHGNFDRTYRFTLKDW